MCATCRSRCESARCDDDIRTLRLLLLFVFLVRRHVLLVDERGHLTKHDSGVAVEEGMRESPSQFLNESTTRGCCGTKTTWAISFDLSECGFSIFLPPVSLPTLKSKPVARQAERPQRTKPMGE